LTISKNKIFFFIISEAKSKKIIVFAFRFVLDSFGLIYGDFCMDLCSVDSDEAMKRGDEALKGSSLLFLSIASSLQFFSQR
jgi:hypothetical protein